MSVIGFLIFVSLSADDFLSPGFVVKEKLIQGTQITAQEYVSIPFQINDVKPVTLLISASDSPVAFDIQVDGPQGMVYHNSDLIKSSLTFIPDTVGNYIVTVKNLSSKAVTMTISDGYQKNYEITQVFLVIISMMMIIGGNYFIVHNYFSSMRNYS